MVFFLRSPHLAILPVCQITPASSAHIHHADDAMARITADRPVWHLRRSGFVVMKRPADPLPQELG